MTTFRTILIAVMVAMLGAAQLMCCCSVTPNSMASTSRSCCHHHPSPAKPQDREPSAPRKRDCGCDLARMFLPLEGKPRVLCTAAVEFGTLPLQLPSGVVWRSTLMTDPIRSSWGWGAGTGARGGSAGPPATPLALGVLLTI